jgi:hypothetical protein
VGGSCICDAGKADCGGVCVDLLSDTSHCGVCSLTCNPGHSCDTGVCSTLATQTSSPSSSQTGSPSQTQSSTGFPQQAVIDNTHGAQAEISTTVFQNMSDLAWRGVTVFFPEADTNCGPGIYHIDRLTMAMSLRNPNDFPSVTVQIYR